MKIQKEQSILAYDLSLPEYVIDRNGSKVFIDPFRWKLHTGGIENDTINVGRYKNQILKYAVSKYLIHQIKTKASSTVVGIEQHIFTQLKNVGFIDKKFEDVISFETSLIKAINAIQSYLRETNKFSDFYEITRWYLWCSEHMEEIGFCNDYALHIGRIKIPGDIKGEAVRSLDPDVGPLNYHLEEPLVRKALILDTSNTFEHLQQRVAVALCLSFGRNPLNYARLRETDFVNITKHNLNADPLWQLQIPRIKKRAEFRELFKFETCDINLALMIQDLISQNQKISTLIHGKRLPRALFLRKTPVSRFLGTDSQSYAFHMTSNDICALVQKWSRRMKLVSPVTGKFLKLTPRRLRYTFACNMARQGVSRAALAEMLDHTDTQNVNVYYELFDDLVPMLDKALAQKIGGILGWFKGTIIHSSELNVNTETSEKEMFFVNEKNPVEQVEIGICGKKDLCHLDPPYTCYLCPKFRPYLEADHERVLEILLEDRNIRRNKYEQSRLVVQLDDVIFAVAEAVVACKGKNHG